MTSPRFFTDPLSGATYPFKGQLTSAQMNQILAGMRAIDYALEWNQATSWPLVDVTLAAGCSAIALDKKWHRLVALISAVGDTSPNTYSITIGGTSITSIGSPTAPAGGWTTAPGVVCSNDTVTIIGGTTVNASNQKVATMTSDGTDFDIQSMSNAEAGVGPTVMLWDPYNELFIAGLDGTGATGKIETSADGTSWSASTASTVATPIAGATDGNGTTVLILSGSGNVAMRSTNGTTWSNVTLPETREWSCITYSPGLGKWFAGDGWETGSETGMNLNYATSIDGITWSTQAYTGMTHSPKLLGCTGNIVFACNGYGNTEYILAAEDGYTFKIVAQAAASTQLSAMFSSPEIIAVLSEAGTELTASAYYAL